MHSIGSLPHLKLMHQLMTANDRLFMKELEQYKNSDKGVWSRDQGFSLHTWYLFNELIPLALFSSEPLT